MSLRSDHVASQRLPQSMAPIDSRYVQPGENCASAFATHAIAEKEKAKKRNNKRAIKVETKNEKRNEK